MARPPVETLLDLIAARDRAALVETARELAAAEGLDAAIAVLGDVQREVGRRWQRQDWSVADEHAATALVDLALAAAALVVPTPQPTLGPLVVTCAEEEWHVVPARMFAEQLRSRSWDVTFLGASTPAEHLGAYVTRRPPIAVAVSCSVPMFLPGARRSIAAAHAAGVPTVAGGAAFGANDSRARAVGADAWAATPGEAHTVATSWLSERPVLGTPRDDREQLALAADRSVIVEHALADLGAHFPGLARYSPWQIEKTREDLEYILRFVEAALLTGDTSIVVDFIGWLVPLLAARGVGPGVVLLGLHSLQRCLPSHHREASRLLTLAELSVGRQHV